MAEFSQQDLFNAILNYEKANDPENAQKVREILMREYPNSMDDIKVAQPVLTEDEKLAQATAADQARTTENQDILANSKGNVGGVPLKAGLNSFSSGYMLVGERLDEMVGEVHGEEAMEYHRRLQEAFSEEYPKTNMALRMAGGITSTIPMGAYAGTAKLYKWLQTLPWWGKYGGGMGAGGLFGMTEGFVSGGGIQGEGETGGAQTRFENAMDMSISGGFWGALGAGAGHALTDVGAKAWVSIKDGLKNNTIPEIKELFDLKSGKTAEIIKTYVQDSSLSFGELMERLRLGGRDAQIPDADDAMAKLLDIITIHGGEGASIVVNSVKDRAKDQLKGVDNVLDKKLGKLEVDPTTGVKKDAVDMAESIAIRTAPKRTKAYKAAYGQKINYNAPDGQNVLAVLNRIDPKIMQQAMSKANARLRFDGEDLGQSGFEIGADGILKMVNNPNMLQLDYLKRALGELAYGTGDVMKSGRFVQTPDAELYSKMYTALNKALRGVNKPKKGYSAYENATRLGQDKIQRQNAIELGQQMLNPNVNSRTITRAMKDAGDAEKAMAKFGFRSKINETLDNVKRTINSPNIDENQVRKLLDSMSTNNVKNKLFALLPKKDANAILKQMETARVALELKASVAKGSQTAERVIGANRVDSIIKGIPDAMGEIAPLRTGQLIAQNVLKSKALSQGRKDLIMKELANAMLGSKGKAARDNFKVLYKAVKDGQATDQQILEIAQFIAGKITVAPVNATMNVMEDTETDANIMLGISNFMQR